MTKLLERAFAQASKLPPIDQDAFAAWMIEELESERNWDRSFERSADALAKLAAEAIAEDDAGRAQPLDPERL